MAALLKTKVYFPELPADLVIRTRLYARLDQALSARLTLVSAPAGFGKTMMVAAWLRGLQAECTQNSAPFRIAWYSIEESDDDLPTFVAYLAAALQGTGPGLLEQWLGSERRQTVLSPEETAGELAAALAEGVDRLGGRLIIVLDDYHAVTDQEIHKFTARFVRHLSPEIHVVLTARYEPPIGVAQLRARHQVAELRAADLAFTLPETQAFLQDAVAADVAPEAVDVLWQQTEGWATGLRLAAISLHDTTDRGRFLRAFAQNTDRHIADYLLDEVLAVQTPDIQDFLLRTSILHRLSTGLCAATLGASELETAAVLEYLERRGLFLVPLDEYRVWSRYHSLFRSMLQARLLVQLPPAEIRASHHRAGQWLAEHGPLEEALHHLTGAGDIPAAIHLLEQQAQDPLSQERWRDAPHWLGLLAPHIVAEHPALLLLQAWGHYFNTRYAQLRMLVEQAQGLLETAELHAPSVGECSGQTCGMHQVLWGQIHAFKASAAYSDLPFDEGMAHAHRALELLPPACGMVRAFVVNILAQRLLVAEGPAAAIRCIQQELEIVPISRVQARLRLYYALAVLHYLAGSLDAMLSAAEAYEQLAIETRMPGEQQMARIILAAVYLERNQVQKAAELLAALFAQADQARQQTLRLAALMVLDIYGEQEKPTLAETALEILGRRLHLYPSAMEQQEIEAMAAFLAVRRGDKEAGERYLQAVGAEEHAPPLLAFVSYRGILQIIICQLLGGRDHLAQASELAERLLPGYRSAAGVREQVGLLVLMAKTLWLRKLEAPALARLRGALALGYPLGLRRVFTGHGQIMAAMLRKLADEPKKAEAVTALLKEIEHEQRAAQPVRALGQKESTEGRLVPAQIHQRSHTEELVESLSPRELDVLQLMAEQLTNNEIARRLVISPVTARNHTVHIYDKLNVRTRREAVARARAFGML